MLRNKRGDTLVMILISIAIILTATIMLLLWMSGEATGKAVEDQTKAKQLALMIDAAEPGTSIFVDYEVKIEGNEAIIVKNLLNAERYSFFNKAEISAAKVQGGTEITVK